jgi:hypothetical protein
MYIFLQNNIYMKVNINNIGMVILIIFLIYFVCNIFTVNHQFLMNLNNIEGFSNVTKRNLDKELESLDNSILKIKGQLKIEGGDGDENFDKDQELYKTIIKKLYEYNNNYIINCANDNDIEKWFEGEDSFYLKGNVFNSLINNNELLTIAKNVYDPPPEEEGSDGESGGGNGEGDDGGGGWKSWFNW